MQRADFEKKVQNKMQELRLHPSDEVWKRVDADIAPKKRRRPVMVWFLLAGLLLAGGSYFVFNNQSSENIAGGKPQQPGQSIAKKQNRSGEADDRSKQDVLRTTENTFRQSNTKSSRTSAVDIPSTAKEKQARNAESAISKDKQSISFADIQLNGEKSDHHIFSLNKELKNTSPLAIQAESVHLINLPHSPQRPPFDEESVHIPLASSKDVNSTAVKKTNWQLGLTVSAGISDLGDQLFGGPAATGLYYMPQSSSGSGVVHKPSDIKRGASFSIGGYAAKTIGRKWTVGTGLAYQYFSTTIKVGEKVDSIVIINQNNFAMDRISGYYRPPGSSRHSYKNQYHFVSLPINVQWQFSKRVAWEIGVVVSKMIKTNALHYDGVSGTYYNDRKLFNDFQVAGSTALLVGLNKNKIQVGPQLQYAFSNLLDNNAGSSKHLRYGGIKANMVLWKY